MRAAMHHFGSDPAGPRAEGQFPLRPSAAALRWADVAGSAAGPKGC